MNSFTFGLWTGFVAGVVLTALLKQSDREPSLEEKLLNHQSAAASSFSPKSSSPSRNLADALAQREKTL